METILEKVDSKKPDRRIVEKAGTILKNGGLVAFPTETVYGLGADGLTPEGAKKIYAAKGRPSDNPLIIHVADFESLEKIVKTIPPEAKALSDAFWPGPLTMILPKSEIVPYETTGGLETVAVRMPVHPVALELIRAGGGYVAAPSANTSGRPSPTKAEHVYEDLAGKIDMILDGGTVGIGLESTIIDLSTICEGIEGEKRPVPMILRPGYITKEMLSEVIGEVILDPGLNEENAKVRPKAPGMRYRHYAPKADLVLVEGENEQVTEYINQLVKEQQAHGRRCGVICTEETKNLYHADVVRNIGSLSNEDEIAHNLYGILREFDSMDLQQIYSESFDTPRIGTAIMNRLLKAAGHQVIRVGE